jgi:hypothetical protein
MVWSNKDVILNVICGRCAAGTNWKQQQTKKTTPQTQWCWMKKKKSNKVNKHLPGRRVRMHQQARLGCGGIPPNDTATSPPLGEKMTLAARGETNQATTGADQPLRNHNFRQHEYKIKVDNFVIYAQINQGTCEQLTSRPSACGQTLTAVSN